MPRLVLKESLGFSRRLRIGLGILQNSIESVRSSELLAAAIVGVLLAVTVLELAVTPKDTEVFSATFNVLLLVSGC